MMSESSLRAYRELMDTDLIDRQRRVLDCVRRYPGMSSNEIARTLTLENSKNGKNKNVTQKDVCSRLNELLKDGKVVVCGMKKDRTTKRRVNQYEISGAIL